MIVNYEIPPIFQAIAQKVPYKPQVWVPHLFTHIPCTYRGRLAKEPYHSSYYSVQALQLFQPRCNLEDPPKPCQCLTAWIQGARPKVAEHIAA